MSTPHRHLRTGTAGSGAGGLTVLVADHDAPARRAMTAALRFAGYTVETARNARHAPSVLRRRPVAAVIVDPGDEEDLSVVALLRALTDSPIIVVSPSADECDLVAALDAGADDYLTKPSRVEELLARLRAALRRSAREPGLEPPLTTPDFTVSVADRRWVRSDGSEVRLTPTEWRLVEVLLQRPGHLVTQSDLLTAVWGPDAATKTEYLRVYFAGIRQKTEPEPAQPRYFITAPGLGVRFEPNPVGLVDSR